MAETRDLLGEQIHLLGDLLGETIREQEGPAIFDLVETIRGLAKAGRAGDAFASSRLLEIVDNLPVSQARAVWLIASEAPMWDERNLTEAWLNRRGAITDHAEFARVAVTRYALR